MKYLSRILFFITAMSHQHRLAGSETGWLNFNTRLSNVVDAPVSRPDGSAPGPTVTAQLFRVSADGSLQPLFPTTTFRTSPAASTFYVTSTTLTVKPIEPFEIVTLRMRAWDGKSYNTASLRGESKDFVLTFGGQPSLQPPMYLSGLEGFKLEPNSVSVILGSSRVDGNKFVFEIQASPGTRVVVQSSPNLRDWQTISVQTLTDGHVQVTDTVGNENRFYRAVVE